MKLLSITIKNFKSFRERTFKFSEKFTLFIGDNGTGKTSVLEALSIGLGGFLAGLDGVKSRNILSDEVRRKTQVVGDATVTTEMQFPVEIKCTARIENQNITWKRTLNREKGKTTYKYSKDIINYASTLQQSIRGQKNDVILPIIAYLSAGRTWSQKRDKWSDPFKAEEVSRFLGYADCLDAESNIKLFVRWFRKMQLIELQKSKKIGELEAVRQAIKTFLKGLIETDTEVNIIYDFAEEEIMIEFGNEMLPLRMMSAGYRVVIGMVADIAYRMALLNPQLKSEATNITPGVVLIDELDLHLHPKWQWRIVKDLKRTFPNVQFIATTHAPVIIASCSDSEFIQLVENQGEVTEIVSKTPNGWLVEDVLEDIMKTYIRSPEMTKMIDRIEQLYRKKIEKKITDSEIDELRDLSEKLQTELPEGDPAVTLAKLDAIEKNIFGSDDNA